MKYQKQDNINFIYVGCDLCCKMLCLPKDDKRNIIIGTTGLCGCVGLGIICETNDKKLFVVSHILSSSSYKEIKKYFNNILNEINKLSNVNINWRDFNKGNFKLKFFSQNPDRQIGETFFEGKRISLENLIYNYFEKEHKFNNFFIEKAGCIGVGSPGFYLENNEKGSIFSSRYFEELPTYDAFEDELKENIIILEKN